MEAAVSWLLSLEERARNFYRRAADLMEDDRDFARFLFQLAADEEIHHDLIQAAGTIFVRQPGPPPLEVQLDAETERQIEEPLIAAEKLLLSGRPTRRQVTETIARIEFCEWNDLFVYFVNRAATLAKTFSLAAAAIEAHRRRIDRLFASLPAAQRPDRTLDDLPSVWKPRFLLVDDDPDLLALTGRFLGRRARVETARDGLEALEKTTREFFDLIVADIDMPRMDGLEFCRLAIEADPRLRRNFLICSGDIGVDRAEFLRGEQLEYIPKPFTLAQLGQAVGAMVARASDTP